VVVANACRIVAATPQGGTPIAAVALALGLNAERRQQRVEVVESCTIGLRPRAAIVIIAETSVDVVSNFAKRSERFAHTLHEVVRQAWQVGRCEVFELRHRGVEVGPSGRRMNRGRDQNLPPERKEVDGPLTVDVERS
jgi:hypothetical protein